MTQLQKDIKLVQKCLHKKLLWSKVSQKPVTSVSEQFIALPLALCDNEGLPLKGQKSFAKKVSDRVGVRIYRASEFIPCIFGVFKNKIERGERIKQQNNQFTQGYNILHRLQLHHLTLTFIIHNNYLYEYYYLYTYIHI